jgi:hypothetical protein
MSTGMGIASTMLPLIVLFRGCRRFALDRGATVVARHVNKPHAGRSGNDFLTSRSSKSHVSPVGENGRFSSEPIRV